MLDGTRKFKIHDDADLEMKQIMTAVYDALREKGYNPINQIVGYILSGQRRTAPGTGSKLSFRVIRHHFWYISPMKVPLRRFLGGLFVYFL